jgi:hypothetical protein
MSSKFITQLLIKLVIQYIMLLTNGEQTYNTTDCTLNPLDYAMGINFLLPLYLQFTFWKCVHGTKNVVLMQ